MLSFDVADMWCWVCVEEEGERERASDVGCCTQHGSQHGRNMWGRGRKTPGWMLHVTLFATCSEHIRNILRWMLHGRRFATWEKLFATSQKFFRNILCASQPDRRLIGSPIRIVRLSTRPILGTCTARAGIRFRPKFGDLKLILDIREKLRNSKLTSPPVYLNWVLIFHSKTNLELGSYPCVATGKKKNANANFELCWETYYASILYERGMLLS
jgi:hypothetical protein